MYVEVLKDHTNKIFYVFVVRKETDITIRNFDLSSTRKCNEKSNMVETLLDRWRRHVEAGGRATQKMSASNN